MKDNKASYDEIKADLRGETVYFLMHNMLDITRTASKIHAL